jgi:group II intron reverse transcriptase/maturase
MIASFSTFHSLSTAFPQVKENQGCAGVDGVTIEEFETELPKNLSMLSHDLKHNQYSPLPFLKILVDKGNGEARALCVPAVKDRVAQTAVLFAIEPILEREFEACSFAFRKGRSVRQAVYKIKDYYDQGYRWVVDADIDAFFDSVDQSLLLQKVGKLIEDGDIIGLIEKWVKAEVWDGVSLKVMEKGIPQGSPLSPILANLFLDELDEVMLKNGQKYVRFADDFLILCKTPEKAKQSLEFTNEMLEKLLLKLDESDIVSFDQGFKYLGVTFVRSLIMVPFDRPKKERKVIYYPPPLNLEAYYLKKRRWW